MYIIQLILNFILNLLTFGLYNQYVLSDATMHFQISGSLTFDRLIDFHDFILIYLVGVCLIFLFFLLLQLSRIQIIAFIFAFLLLFFVMDFSVSAATCSDSSMLDYLNSTVTACNQTLSSIGPIPPLVLSSEQINGILDTCSTRGSVLDALSVLYEGHITHSCENFKYLMDVYAQYNEALIGASLDPIVLSKADVIEILTNYGTKDLIFLSFYVKAYFLVYIKHMFIYMALVWLCGF